MTSSIEVHRLRTRLDAAIARAPAPSADPEVQSDFARYLCVLICGFLERALVALVVEYAQRRGSHQLAAFVESQLRHWTNPSAEKICNLFGALDADWREQVAAFLVDERKASVNSILALRHKIAHGDSVGVSLAQVKAYYADVRAIVEFVESVVD